MKKIYVLLFVILLLIIIFVSLSCWVYFSHSYSNPSLINRFDNYSNSFQNIADAIMTECRDGNITYLANEHNNTLDIYRKKNVYTEDDVRIVADFLTDADMDCIDYHFAKKDFVVFVYGLGSQYIVYSENDTVSRRELLKYLGIDTDNTLYKCKLKENWYYFRFEML